jgi:hypothetical protein
MRGDKRRRRETAYAVARRLQAIGCDDDPRTDVAARHAHYLKEALRAKARPSARAPRRNPRRG